MKFAIIPVKTVKQAMENVHSLFSRVLIGKIHLFKPLKREHCPHCNHATHLCHDHAFKVFYKSILHCSVHRVTASILYIVLPFGSIITIQIY